MIFSNRLSLVFLILLLLSGFKKNLCATGNKEINQSVVLKDSDFVPAIQKALNKKTLFSEEFDPLLYSFLTTNNQLLKESKIAIITRNFIAYESILLSFNIHPTVLTDITVVNDSNRIKYISYETALKDIMKFDVLIFTPGSNFLYFDTDLIKQLTTKNALLILPLKLSHPKNKQMQTIEFNKQSLYSLFPEWKMKYARSPKGAFVDKNAMNLVLLKKGR